MRDIEVKSAPKIIAGHIHGNVTYFVVGEVFVSGSRHPYSLAEKKHLETVANLETSCLYLPEECLTQDHMGAVKKSDKEAIADHSHRLLKSLLLVALNPSDKISNHQGLDHL